MLDLVPKSAIGNLSSASVMGFDVPILFLIFNRPDLTQRVFESIRRRKPARLYVAADGPRPEVAGERQLCVQARNILDQVDWDCDLQTLLRDQNLGCGRAVSEAITWFFVTEKEGIILEDDCLPSDSFYLFCAEMLERFRGQTAVGSISGDCFFPRSLRHSDPYFFSKYAQIWGWATWRRTWQQYELDLTGPLEEWERIVRKHNAINLEAKYWLEIYKALKSGLIDTWDYQLMFSCWRHSQVHIAPTRNLVENLGYGPDATHATDDSPLRENVAEEISGYEVSLPVRLDPQLDQTVMFFRFLESLDSPWWLHQAVDVTEKLGWARWQANQAAKELKLLRRVSEEQAAAIQEIFASRTSSKYEMNYGILFLRICHKAWNMINALRMRYRTRRMRISQTRKVGEVTGKEIQSQNGIRKPAKPEKVR
jgi:hypothetical protein